MAEKRSLDSKSTTDLAKLRRRITDMDTQRQPWISVWEEIAKYVSPGRGIFDQQEPNKGQRKDQHLLDPTPLQALHVLGAGMQGGLTSPSRPWFRLGVTDPELADNGPVRLWLDDVERRMTHVLGQSNVYNCLHTLYAEVGAFGTGAMLVEEDIASVVRGRTMTVGEYYISYTASGLPETFARVFWMTASQMAEEFGRESLSDAASNALENERVARWFRVCHWIGPNVDYKESVTLSGNLPILSVYWEESQTDKPLRVSGYEEFPVMAPRWEVVGSDFYGRGPGWGALGEAKTLQEMRFDYLVAQKMGIQPPVVGSLGLRKARVNLEPGGVTFMDDANGVFRPVYQVRPDIPGQLQAMSDSRDMIKTTFFADLFLTIIMSGNRDMTAREVEERHNEKMMMLGPVLERLENELLNPLIGRVFTLMDRRGLIPPPPEELEGRELKVEYISTLAQAQQMVGLGGIDRLAQFVGGIAQFKPDVLDKFDADEATDQYARALGTPASIVVSDDVVAALRQQRAQQQQQQQQMVAAQQMAQTAQTGAQAAQGMSNAAASGGLDQLAGMMQDMGGAETM